MALENLKSTPLSNADATPKVINNARVMRMPSWEAVGTCEVAASSDVGPPASTYRLCRVPSNARISQVLAWADASGNAGQLNIGIYETPENGGAAVDADFFIAGANFDPGGGAAINAMDVTHGNSSGFNIDDAEKPLWEVLGLSADPQKDYDITASVAEAPQSGFTVTLKVRYGL